MKNKRGITLIELILVLALMGIVLSLVFSPIIFSFKNFERQNEKANVISDARATMDYLIREIRKADAVDTVNGSLNIDSKDLKGGLTIDSHSYEVKNRVLYKDDINIIEGVDDITIDGEGEPITIVILIKQSKKKDYKLSSDINLR